MALVTEKQGIRAMSLSETSHLGDTKRLDEVRAKIFYLASDVESASEPAAIMLRAVAESIVDGADRADRLNGNAALNGVVSSLRYAGANGMR